MTRRTGWILGGASAVIVIVAAVAVWLMLFASPQTASTPEPTPSASASNDVRADAQSALEEHLDGCTSAGAPNGVVTPGCGIRIPWGAEFATVSDVRFRIESMPELVLTPDDGFTADGGVLVATVTGTGQDGVARTETYRTDTWGVRGQIEDTADGVAVVVW